MHLGHPQVICAFERDGVIVDPGPESCIETLLAGLEGEAPRALLLTHIHLDHAGASGALVRRYPELLVYVHERGAKHVSDPSRLVASATQLWGADNMAQLWGEVLPVPEANMRVLEGGETVEGYEVAYTPGHAWHHVSYFDGRAGEAFTGDVAGVRIAGTDAAFPPTPPPDIDLEAWSASLDVLEEWGPDALCITHFGRSGGVEAHIAQLRERLATWGERARHGSQDEFVAAGEADYRAGLEPEAAEALLRASAPAQCWFGLERYWRKRAEREAAAAEAP